MPGLFSQHRSCGELSSRLPCCLRCRTGSPASALQGFSHSFLSVKHSGWAVFERLQTERLLQTMLQLQWEGPEQEVRAAFHVAIIPAGISTIQACHPSREGHRLN